MTTTRMRDLINLLESKLITEGRDTWDVAVKIYQYVEQVIGQPLFLPEDLVEEFLYDMDSNKDGQSLTREYLQICAEEDEWPSWGDSLPIGREIIGARDAQVASKIKLNMDAIHADIVRGLHENELERDAKGVLLDVDTRKPVKTLGDWCRLYFINTDNPDVNRILSHDRKSFDFDPFDTMYEPYRDKLPIESFARLVLIPFLQKNAKKRI